MPDHLHALVGARSEGADVDAMAQQFAQLTDGAYRQQTRRPLWQPGHQVRELRDDEASDAAARYILENPIRAGLTRYPGDYPFAWSDVYDLESLLVRRLDAASIRRRGCRPSRPAARSLA